MENKKLVSNLAAQIFTVLQQKQDFMTAEQIAKQLSVLPNTIYRASRQLVALGVVTKTKTYPVKYKSRVLEEAWPWYLLEVQKKFRESFGEIRKDTVSKPERTTLTIVKDRDDFLRKTTRDALQATHEINLIVSGLEVPDETILTYRKVIARGVKVRAIVQEHKGTTKARLEDWSGIGVGVRHASYLGLRLFVSDSRNTYLVSYGHKNKEQALGVRYDYAPLADSMNDFFEQKWLAAKPLNSRVF